MGRLWNRYFSLLFFLFLFVPLSFSSSSSEYFRQLGKSYYIKGDYQEAVKEFTKAVLADPSDELSQEYLKLAKEKKRKQEIDKYLDYLETSKEEPTLAKKEPSPKERVYAEEASPKKLPYRAPKREEEKIERTVLKDKKKRKKESNIEIRGDYQLSFGVEKGDVYWKRANYDLNEENWRTLSGAGLNNYENSYDPAIFSKLQFTVETKKEEGLGFHFNMDISPWSFIGKSNKILLRGAGGDRAEVELKYSSNTGYTLAETIYTLDNGDAFSLPEIKVVRSRILPVNITSLFANIFSLPELEIHREFWPFREIWVDYNQGPLSLRIFPVALHSQAYTSDDILGLSNHKTYWEESPWLDYWNPGHYNSGGGDFFPGYWDDALTWIAKDSSGTFLGNLRGFTLSLASDLTNLDVSFSSPKHLWQDYDEFDTYNGAVRLKHRLSENFQIGSTYTTKIGFKEDKLDATIHSWGVDFTYGFSGNSKMALEVASSKAVSDKASGYKTDRRGNALKLRYVFSSQEDIFDKNFYEIVLPQDSTQPFWRGMVELAHMDEGFRTGLSNYKETKDDSYWSRHIYFRKPFDYYYTGLYGPSLSWEDIEPYKIGDGIDYGRDVIRLRYEFKNLLGSSLDGLLDVRNIHSTEGKFIENVTHLEATYRLNERLKFRLLGIHHKLPHTKANQDPFLVNEDTGDYLSNTQIKDGQDPSLKTVSLGTEYEILPKISLSFVWEHSNDTTLAFDNFPRGLLTWSSFTTYTEEGYIFRKLIQGLNHPGVFPLPPYPYFDIFKVGLRLSPLENLEIYLDWTKNEYGWAQGIDDNVNHIGLELAYQPLKNLGFYLRYTYSKMYDYSELNDNQGANEDSHHNFFSEVRFSPWEDNEFILQYGVGSVTPIGVSIGSPFGGSLPVLDTQHIFRVYYRRKF